ncbi:MAG: hypothetical protein NT034_02230 [Candidatus Magasanikbacteria bacterium]|nr:hypothetical protein [Candidatus Magasanikbacteria bacterium]
MFRHQDKNMPPENKTEVVSKSEDKVLEKPIAVPVKTEHEILKDLMEKNLKWSQIIYEQNRKIHNKLMWTAVAGWLRVILILAPLLWAIWYLPGLVKNLQNNYGFLGGRSATSTAAGTQSMEQLLKILPLDAAKQEQLNALLK